MNARRTTIALAAVLALAGAATGCDENVGETGSNNVTRSEDVHQSSGPVTPTAGDSLLITGTGTIRRLELEGGFWGIVSDDSTKYDPGELDARFQQDGMRVRFDLRRAEGQMTIRQWGTLVTVVRLDPL